MAPPATTPGAGAVAGSDLPADPARTGSRLLAREDVALVPIAVVAAGSFALALSQWLRPTGGEHSAHADAIIITVAILHGLGGVGFVFAARHFGLVRLLRGAVWPYALGATALVAMITAAAVLDRGLATVAVTAVVPLSAYIGLVFPRQVAQVFLAILLMLLGAIHAIHPDADGLGAGSLFVLVVAGWVAGLIPRGGHQLASRQALILSRSDALTKALNRRGFLEQLEFTVREAAQRPEPIALIVIDLNGFKRINDQQGHAAGDELLAWVGGRVPTVLPEAAEFGRLGGDEFAILLRGVTEAAAEAVAKTVHATLSERVGSSVGVGISADGDTEPIELLRLADGALYAAKAEPTRRVQVRELPPAGRAAQPAAPRGLRDRRTPRVSFADLRRSGSRALVDRPLVAFDGSWLFLGFFTIAAGGLAFITGTWLWGGNTFYEEVVRYGGLPWVLLNVAAGLIYRRRYTELEKGWLLPLYGSGVLLAVGLSTAALSTGDGAASPILAGLYLKLIFDASIFPRAQARRLALLMVAAWVLVLALGPPEVWWVIPFQAVLFVGSYRLGRIGRNALDSATQARMQQAMSDPVTGVLNRRGFMTNAERILAAAPRTGRSSGGLDLPVPVVISMDLDGFKEINDTLGHVAGDEVLRRVAEAWLSVLGRRYSIARLGGDEFVAIGTAVSLTELEDVEHALSRALLEVTPGSIGTASFGRDGVTLDQLLQVADRRAYAVKRARVEAAAAEAAAAAADEARKRR